MARDTLTESSTANSNLRHELKELVDRVTAMEELVGRAEAEVRSRSSRPFPEGTLVTS